MDRVPNELLNTVFIQLNLQERLICMLVCRKWWLLIDKYSLLYNVKIVGNVDCFNRFMTMIDRAPHRAAQVEELVLKKCVGVDFDQRTLCDTFHNARIIKLTHNSADLEKFTHFDKHIAMIHVKSKIEFLSDSLYCPLISQLLVFNLCGALHTLELVFPNDDKDAQGQTIVVQMTNLPVLKSLGLKHLSIRIEQLEVLHQNVPSIQNFTLEYVDILESRSPCGITPVDSMTSFDIHVSMVTNLETHIQWFKYMKRKYTNLTSTRYMDESLDLYDWNTMSRFFSEEILGFLQLIGPTSTAVHVTSLPRDINVFKTLDEAKSRARVLVFTKCESQTLLEDLSRSNQSRYVKRLCFFKTIVNSPCLLQDMPELTSITLLCLEHVDFLAYVNAFPATVKEFSVTCQTLKVDGSNARCNSIEALLINCDNSIPEFGIILSECFPKLVELKLICPLSTHLHIIPLDDQPLEEVVLRTKRYSPHGFVFVHLDQVKYYLCDDKTTLVTRKDIEDLPWLTFTTDREFNMKLSKDNDIVFFHEPEHTSTF
jgi:hypothetical protein